LILDGHDSHNFVELIDLAIQNQPFKEFYNSAAQDMVSKFPGVVANKSTANLPPQFLLQCQLMTTSTTVRTGCSQWNQVM